MVRQPLIILGVDLGALGQDWPRFVIHRSIFRRPLDKPIYR